MTGSIVRVGDILGAIRRAEVENSRRRGLFCSLADAYKYREDDQFLAAAAFEFIALSPYRERVTKSSMVGVINLSHFIRAAAFKLDGDILRPGWREGTSSVAMLNDNLSAFINAGLVRAGFTTEDFRLRLLPGQFIFEYPLFGLEAAEQGREVRRCVECRSWMIHDRNGALYCNVKCSGRTRARKARSRGPEL